MLEKQDYLNNISSEVSALCGHHLSEEKQQEILEFIKTTINGDTPKFHLTIDANLTKDKKGVIVYILTNTRLIKIDIALPHEIKSASFVLNKMISVERKLIEDGRSEVLVTFENGSFGLSYLSKNINITNFFQEVDQYRIKGL